MAWATLGGTAVLAATLSLPRTGAWRATVVLDADAAPAGPVTLSLADGASLWACTVYRAGSAFGKAVARLVGGKHGLAKPLGAQGYRNVSAGIVVRDILAAAGESLAASASAQILATNLDHWARTAQAAQAQLQQLVDALGASWRVLQDGTVWVGAEAWPAAPSFEYDLLERAPHAGKEVLATTSMALLPGTVFGGRRVGYVEQLVESGKFRTSVWYEDT